MSQTEEKKGIGRRVQAFGSFLSSMIMPNIGAFIAWGFIAAIFIDNGWFPNKDLATLAGPMITYLIPLLIAFSGGRLIYDLRGGIIAATATMGVIVALPDTPMLLGAMIMGPLVGWLMKKTDQLIQPRTPQGFEMLFNNFSAGILGFIMTIAGFKILAPLMKFIMHILSVAVEALVHAHLLPLVSILVEPAKIVFLNNAINHGVFTPLGADQAAKAGQSILYTIESNPGPGLGILLAYMIFGKGTAKATSYGAGIIHFLGGIHEIYFPYVLMRPLLFIAVILEGNRFLNILVVCSSGMGTSRLLSTRLEQVFSEIERITQASVSDLKSLDLSQYDGIISTVNLDIDSPYLTVNPLLPDSDISYVAQFLNTKSTFQETHDKSSNMIDKDDVHVETKDIDGNTSFENEQTSYLTSVFEKHLSDEKSEQLMHHMRSGLTLLDSVKIVSTEVKQWQTYIADYLYQCDVINDPTSFAELLEQRLIDNPGWILSPYPVAIPHLRDNMIKHPMILITVLEEPLTLPSIQNDNQTIKYMISMFIPDNDFMASLVSDLSEFLSLKLESIDTFMENPQELETLLRNKFLERIKKQFI